MVEAKLVYYCAMDLHPELECGLNCSECEYLRVVFHCPHCQSHMQHDYALNIETGSLDAYMFCNACGYSE